MKTSLEIAKEELKKYEEHIGSGTNEYQILNNLSYWQELKNLTRRNLIKRILVLQKQNLIMKEQLKDKQNE